jgi:hypothetical protein
MALTTPLVDAWLYATLTGDATLTALVAGRVHRLRLPQDGAYPAVVFAHQGGSALLAGGGVRVWSDLVYLVKAVGQGGGAAGLKAAADRIDALLHAARGSVAGGVIVACVLEAEVAYDEDRNGIVYQHLGAQYRIYAQAA